VKQVRHWGSTGLRTGTEGQVLEHEKTPGVIPMAEKMSCKERRTLKKGQDRMISCKCVIHIKSVSGKRTSRKENGRDGEEK